MLTRRRLLAHGTTMLIFRSLMASIVVGCTNVTNIMVAPPPDAPPESPPKLPCDGGIMRISTISDCHNHSVCVLAEDLTAPPAVGARYTSSNDGDHNHTIKLTSAQLAMIAAGETVTVTSSADVDPLNGDNHSHDWTFTKT